MVSITSLRSAAVLRAQQRSDPGFGEPAHVVARRNRPVVDGLPLRVRSKGVGKGQRRASIGCSRVHGDRNDSAERETADVRLSDTESRHRGEDCGRKIVARGLVAELAVAVAGIVERERPARPPEMLQLRFPHRLVGADSVEENQGVRSPPPTSTVPIFPSAVSMLAMPST